MNQILKEMPHLADAECPYCGFKFMFDARIERWTNDKKQNRKFLDDFFRIDRKIAIECPQCHKAVVFDAAGKPKPKTYKYDDIINKVKPSIRKFFNQSIKLTKPLLKIGISVIPEQLTFKTFVDGQIDGEE